MTRKSNYAGYELNTLTSLELDGFKRKISEPLPDSSLVNDFRTDDFVTFKGVERKNCACDHFGNMCLYHWYYEIKTQTPRKAGQPYGQEAQQQEAGNTSGRVESGTVRDGSARADRGRGHSAVRGDSPQHGNRPPGRSKRR